MFSIIEVFRVFDGGRRMLEEVKHFQPAQEQADLLENMDMAVMFVLNIF